jgi:hypothetical protein
MTRYVDLSGPASSDPVGSPSFDGGRYTDAVAVTDFAGNRKRDLPPGWRVSLWNAPGVAEAELNSFLAADVVIGASREPGKDIEIWSFHLGIAPVYAEPKETPEPYARTQYVTTYPDGRRATSGTGGGSAWLGEKFRYADRAYCLQRAQFPDGRRYVLDPRLSRSITGWVHGRLDQPHVEIRRLDDETNLVRIAGGPAQLPLAIQAVPDRQMAPDLGARRGGRSSSTRPSCGPGTFSPTGISDSGGSSGS